MRHKDPALMETIRRYVDQFYTGYDRMPSLAEISRALGIGRTTAYKYLVAMDAQGLLHYRDGEISTDLTDTVSDGAPLTSVFNESIACGTAEEIEASVRERVRLPVSMFGSGEMFVIRTHGESMIDAGIEPGDMVVVERRQDARPGDIVVALTESGNTLKRLGYDRSSQRYFLHPENPTMEDIWVDELEIQGVVSFIVKKPDSREPDQPGRQGQQAKTGKRVQGE